VAFVDSLAVHLDDHAARGAQLAARLHLSRFHFDRIVSSVGGETPARFRRRVLLERAAYRLLTCDRTVLDVGVEAGYASHEAFTRAFQRAYGVPPAAWRAAPRRIQLDTPNGVHFHPPGSLRLPARAKVTAIDLLTKMVEHHIWLVGEMIERARRLPAGELDKRIEVSVDDDRQTLRSLLSRLVGQMDMWNCAIANRPYGWSVEEHEDLDAMRERLARVAPAFLGEVEDVVAGSRLDETFVDALCEPAEVFTYGGMIAHVLTFAAHNRTPGGAGPQEGGDRGSGVGGPDEMGGRAGVTRVPGRSAAAWVSPAMDAGGIAARRPHRT
jgi:AraC family transcriptional regulator